MAMAEAATPAPALTRPVKHRLEAAVAGVLLRLLRALPLTTASAVAGNVARALGPYLPVSNRARQNLRRTLPELDDAAIEAIVHDMWENLGRVAGEMPHLASFRITDVADRPGTVEVVGREHLQGIDRGAVLVGGHIANWEIQPLTISRCGVDLSVVYRAANNRLVDRMITGMRGPIANETVPKGPVGARRLLTLLKDGRAIGMLVDQKMNDGIPAPFFGRMAMTAPAPAQLALKFDVPMIPVRCERLGGPRFRVTFEAPLPLPPGSDRQAAVAALTTAMNARIEHWIRQRPAQWLWLHRRWPD